MKTRMGNLIVGAMLVALSTMQYAEAGWTPSTSPEHPGRIYKAWGAARMSVGISSAETMAFCMTWQLEHGPPSTYREQATRLRIDVEGGIVVGEYWAAGSRNGFIYDGTTGRPQLSGGSVTIASGIDGTSIVGYYGHWLDGSDDRGFLYNGEKDVDTLDVPGAIKTIANSVDLNGGTGGIIVGCGQTYADYGWLYDIDKKEFTPNYGPGGVLAYPFDMDGGNIVGWYGDAQTTASSMTGQTGSHSTSRER